MTLDLSRIWVAAMFLVSNLFVGPVLATQNQVATESTASWKTVGKGRFKFAFWSIYDAELRSQNGQYNATEVPQQQLPLSLTLTYLRDIEKSDLVSNTFEQWQKQGLDVATLSKYRAVLDDLWPDVKKGDSLGIQVFPTYSQFLHNGQRLGTPLTAEFGQVFIGIWLNNNTTEPELRSRLIGVTR